MSVKDMTGRFGKMIILKQVRSVQEASGWLRVNYKCKCDCGSIFPMTSRQIKRRAHHACPDCTKIIVANASRNQIRSSYLGRV